MLLAHIIDLKLMVDVGCRFALNDLEWFEWEGLKHFRIEQNLAQEEARKKSEEQSKFRPLHGPSLQRIK